MQAYLKKAFLTVLVLPTSARIERIVGRDSVLSDRGPFVGTISNISPVPTFKRRINVGSEEAVYDRLGNMWEADVPSLMAGTEKSSKISSNWWGKVIRGTQSQCSSPVNTDNHLLYRTVRTDATKRRLPDLGMAVPLSPSVMTGTCLVRIHFCDFFGHTQEKGRRFFNVTVNQKTIFEAYDPNEAGGFTASVLTVKVTEPGDVINMTFEGIKATGLLGLFPSDLLTLCYVSHFVSLFRILLVPCG